MKSRNFLVVLSLIGVAGMITPSSVATAATHATEVNLYAYRQPFLMNALLDACTKKTGVKVNMV